MKKSKKLNEEKANASQRKENVRREESSRQPEASSEDMEEEEGGSANFTNPRAQTESADREKETDDFNIRKSA
jgi:hypothetical protein